MGFIDRFINGTTMYKLILYGLTAMVIFAIGLSLLGYLSYAPLSLFLSWCLLCAVCYGSNFIFAKIWKAPVNLESSFITACILFLVMYPATTTTEALYIVLAGVLAMASKYVFAVRGKHIFNPAAAGMTILGLLQIGSAVWWVGTPFMLPVTTIAGLLVVRKIRRFPLFFVCVGASLLTAGLYAYQQDVNVLEAVLQHLLSWPIIFFASIMVTEPLTMPPKLREQLLYGLFIGIVSSWPIVLGPIYFTPELVLVIANLFAFSVSLRRRLFLKLKEKKQIAQDTYEFVFDLDQPLKYQPGQYLEWTLVHAHADSRGSRRFFTIASSPTEKELKLGVKIGEQSSSFKKNLQALQPSDKLVAGALAGDFIMPKDAHQKLVFIAGGIGITPFRSMVRYLVDKNEKRDTVLFYANKTEGDIAYKNLFLEAEQRINLKTIYVVTNDETGGHPKIIDEPLINKHVPDYKERMFYLSGPNSMVNAYKALLRRIGVPRQHIKTDYFPGFA